MADLGGVKILRPAMPVEGPVQAGDPIGPGRNEGQVMADQYHRDSLGTQLLQQGAELLLSLDVDPSGRLVEQQRIGCPQECPGEQEAPLLTSREVHEGQPSLAVEAYPFHQGVGPFPLGMTSFRGTVSVTSGALKEHRPGR